MKVILTQELKGRGGEGDIVEVARGFAVNYLLPRGLAITATPGNVKQLEQRMHNIKKREESRLTGAGSFAGALDGKTITIEVKVGEHGRLFGSVTTHMVADAIAAQLGVEVDRRKVETHGHIKDVGSHPVEIAIYRDIKASITLEVVGEGGVVATEEVVAEVVEAPVVEAEVEEADVAPEAEVPAEAEEVESEVVAEEE